MSLRAFILDGAIDQISLGKNRVDIQSILGPPPNWRGKPPVVIGRSVAQPRDSAIWNYFDSALGVGFDTSNRVVLIIARLEKQRSSRRPFLGWPPLSEWTLGQLRAWCIAEQITYESALPNESNQWVILGKRCGVVLPFSDVDDSRILESKIGMLVCFEREQDASVFARTGKFPENVSD